VVDSSVLVEGLVSENIDKLNTKCILIHEALLAFIEEEAGKGTVKGQLGVDELSKLKLLSQKRDFQLTFSGKRPHHSEISNLTVTEIDRLSRLLAFDESATLITANKHQSQLAKVQGIPVFEIRLDESSKKIRLESFFRRHNNECSFKRKFVTLCKKRETWKLDIPANNPGTINGRVTQNNSQ